MLLTARVWPTEVHLFRHLEAYQNKFVESHLSEEEGRETEMPLEFSTFHSPFSTPVAPFRLFTQIGAERTALPRIVLIYNPDFPFQIREELSRDL